MFNIVDSGRCTGCGTCVDVCPQGAISVRNNVAVIDHRICSQCGSCIEVCPTGAIHIVEPVHAALGKGGDSMRGRAWFGWGGSGMGRGMGFGRGMGRGSGFGRGNPYPFCRFYPWLPRRWWAYRGGYYRTAQPLANDVSPPYGAPLPYPW